MVDRALPPWRKATMREAVAFFASGDPFLKLEYSPSGIPVLAKGDVKPFGRIEHGEKRFVPAALVAARRFRTTQPGDYLLTTRDLTQAADFLGLLAPVPKDQPYLVNQGANVVRFHPDIDGRYLVYWCNGPVYRAYIKGHHVGSTQIHLRKEDFFDSPLWLPTRDEQHAIAYILGTIDDKIELNWRMNETLETMAQALFESWFVVFDPVRAKAEGRETGLPREIADLFPDRLVKSEIGEVPEGWPVRQLEELVDIVRGLSYKGSGLNAGGIPMHNLNSIYEGGGYKEEGLKYYDGEYQPRHVARSGDLLVANTEQGHHRLLIGYAAIVPPTIGPVSLFSHHLYKVSPKPRASLSSEYLCYLLNSRVMHDTVSGYANGTTVNMMPSDALQKPLGVQPPKTLVDNFTILAQGTRGRMELLSRESRTLGRLRDELLPKLISGKVRVQGAHSMAREL